MGGHMGDTGMWGHMVGDMDGHGDTWGGQGSPAREGTEGQPSRPLVGPTAASAIALLRPPPDARGGSGSCREEAAGQLRLVAEGTVRGLVAAAMSAALDLRSKEEKDAELDKRIEALRKKNEALIKRYQEIEEDRKKAEQEGIAVTALRRVRPPEPKAERRWVDAGTLQVMFSPGEKRVVKDKKASGPPKPGRGASPRVSGGRAGLRPLRSPRGEPPPDALWEGSGRDSGTAAERGGGGRRLKGRGGAGPGMGGDAGPDQKSKEWEERRRRNIEKMNEEMEKIAEYERNQRDGLHEKNPVRNFLDDPRRSGPFQEMDRKEGSRRHVRNWGGADFDKVKAGMEREKTWQGPGRRSSPKTGGQLDMTLSMTGRERAEYVRWKKEREQIDQERLARHRKPTGQWRREWDAEKSDSMFKEGSAAAPGLDAGGGEETRRFPPKPPTFGEFLTPRRTQRRKKGRGQGAGTKPYSMHDNRWEEKEAPSDEAENQRVEETPSGAPPEPPASLSPEEDEDQWEDVSEEEEEDEGGSPGSSSEAEAPRSASPPAQRPPRTGPLPPSTPPSPFSPLGGHQPVWDWGEEMDLASPRSSLGDSPLSGPTVPKSRGAPGETPGAPLPPCQPDAEAAPGMVEITDFQRAGHTPRCPPSPASPPP
ncbi:coiled-coil domain-containing protein 9-like isoform X2 [Larus michahellis]|uniref:coiled-coil domain-containing protein 9-like isoform X2 n=1 Tax=Larus michahellis TaxID=119627 RepID=UPI003D9B620E